MGNKKNVLQQRVHKVKVWEAIEAITNVVNHVATTCVMNWSRGHWLLSNALMTPIALIVYMEAKFE